jgi:hypothetical protein
MPYQTSHHTDAQSAVSRRAGTLDDLSAGCDPEFDAAYDDLDREFAEFRCQLGHA